MLYIYIYIYICMYVSINGRQINYKYIIATNSFMYVTAIFRLYNMEENCLMLHLYALIKCKLMKKFIV